VVQVDPINPMLKPPGTKRLKLKYVKVLSILLQFCFQIQLAPPQQDEVGHAEEESRQGLTLAHFSAHRGFKHLLQWGNNDA